MVDPATLALIVEGTKEGVNIANNQGWIDLGKMFTLPGTPTPSGQDPEYEMNVERTMLEERNYAQEVVKRLGLSNPNDDAFIGIANALQKALGDWGSKGSYTRNVANPSAFYSQVDAIAESYDPTKNIVFDNSDPINQQYSYTTMYDPNSKSFTAVPIQNASTTTEQTTNDFLSDNMVMGLGIGAVVLVIIILLIKK